MFPEAARYKKEWQAAQKTLRAREEDCAFVYVHLQEDMGEPFYVGIGESGSRPWSMERSEFHDRVREKHGVRVEIIADGLSWESACFWEQRWIKALRGAGYRLVNLTDGGEGMVNPSAEVRANLRAKRKAFLAANPDKHPSKSPEARAKNSASKKAFHAANPDKNPMKRPEIASKLSGPNHFTKKIPGYKTIFETDKNPGYSEKNLIRMRGPENPMKNPETAKNNSQKRLGQKRTPEQIKNIKKGQQAHQDRITDEERAISTAKQIETKIKNGTLVTVRTKEENIAAGRKSWKTRRERGTDKCGKQDISPEKATARAQKGWETRKKKGNVKSTRSEAERKATGQKIWVTRRLNQLRAEQYWGA